MSYLYDISLNNIDESWKNFFKYDVIELLEKIESQIGMNYYPAKENVLRFARTNLDDVKCVIVGMEPYASSFLRNGEIVPQATGRSFEVASLKNKSWDEKFNQSSLQNILKAIYYNETGEIKSLHEIRQEIDDETFMILPPSKLFNNLEMQGVLFLNATLTVAPGATDTHTAYWQEFMNRLINYIDREDIKWFLWGNLAKNRVCPIISKGDCVLACHPRLPGFVTDNPFRFEDRIAWTGYVDVEEEDEE